MSYSFDTNVFIELERNYKKEENPKMWDILEQKLSNLDIVISEEVIEELQRKNPNSIGKWIKDNYGDCIVETSIEIQELVRKLVNRYKGWINPHSTVNKADPYGRKTPFLKMTSISVIAKSFLYLLVIGHI